MNIFRTIRSLFGFNPEVSQAPIDKLDTVLLQKFEVEEKIEKAQSEFNQIDTELSLKIAACDKLIEKGVKEGGDNKKFLVDRLDRITNSHLELIKGLVDEKKSLDKEKVEIETDIIAKAIQITSQLDESDQAIVKGQLDVWKETGLIKGEEVDNQARAITLVLEEIVKGGVGSGRHRGMKLKPISEDERRKNEKSGKSFDRDRDSHPLHSKVEKFMEKFSDKPKSWKEATGELADIHATMADEYNGDKDEKDKYKKHEGYSRTAEESNKRHKEGIRHLLGKLSDRQKSDVENHYKEWFNKGESEENALEKGGEGSKGGKIIGHTKSGKPIYYNKSAAEHDSFSAQDHIDAHKCHEDKIKDIRDKMDQADDREWSDLERSSHYHSYLSRQHRDEAESKGAKRKYHVYSPNGQYKSSHFSKEEAQKEADDYTKRSSGYSTSHEVREDKGKIQKSHEPIAIELAGKGDIIYDSPVEGHYANVIVTKTFKEGDDKTVEKILFLKRAPHKVIAPNQYCLPGGHIDEGETIEQAASRELKEEANITADCYLIGKAKCDDGKWAFYLNAYPQYNDVALLDGENNNAHWMSREEWIEADLIFDLKDHLVAILSKSRKVSDIPDIMKGEEIEKASKGAGSRGGKILGYTRSLKPIYAGKKGDDVSYRFFSDRDHAEAATIHREAGEHEEAYSHGVMEEKHKFLNEYYDRKGMTRAEQKKWSDRAKEIGIDLEKAEAEELDLIKGGKKAMVGEKREFGGKMYVKVHDGPNPWRLYKESSGQKNQEAKEPPSKPAVASVPKVKKEESAQKTSEKKGHGLANYDIRDNMRYTAALHVEYDKQKVSPWDARDKDKVKQIQEEFKKNNPELEAKVHRNDLKEKLGYKHITIDHEGHSVSDAQSFVNSNGKGRGDAYYDHKNLKVRQGADAIHNNKSVQNFLNKTDQFLEKSKLNGYVKLESIRTNKVGNQGSFEISVSHPWTGQSTPDGRATLTVHFGPHGTSIIGGEEALMRQASRIDNREDKANYEMLKKTLEALDDDFDTSSSKSTNIDEEKIDIVEKLKDRFDNRQSNRSLFSNVQRVDDNTLHVSLGDIGKKSHPSETVQSAYKITPPITLGDYELVNGDIIIGHDGKKLDKQVEYKKAMARAKDEPWSEYENNVSMTYEYKKKLKKGESDDDDEDFDINPFYNEDEFEKAFNDEDLIKGRAAAEGEERTWGGKRYKKSGGKWMPVGSGKRGDNHSKAEHLGKTLEGHDVYNAEADHKVYEKYTPEQHIALAKHHDKKSETGPSERQAEHAEMAHSHRKMARHKAEVQDRKEERKEKKLSTKQLKEHVENTSTEQLKKVASNNEHPHNDVAKRELERRGGGKKESEDKLGKNWYDKNQSKILDAVEKYLSENMSTKEAAEELGYDEDEMEDVDSSVFEDLSEEWAGDYKSLVDHHDELSEVIDELHGGDEKDRGEKKPNAQVNKLLESLKVSDNDYEDWTKITVEATPKGNWRVYYEGKDTGLTYQGKHLSDSTIRDFGLEHRFTEE